MDDLPTRARTPVVARRREPMTSARVGLHAFLAGALTVVAMVTLTPEGTGWSWGDPLTELRWYATAPDSAATMLQLMGNLSLLVLPAALAVLLWPTLGRPRRIAAAALAAGAGIEVLQWVLPLGRVVSPVDAVLNAVGAVAAALLVGGVARSSRRAWIA